ncbi:MAG: asparagine synthase (glutamine-hydrolyzing) [Deltaproteobacteria bacterium]|nr:asparagine synthase (glutamine-hydrolyzing) [Deltaproteobacteria bacterium]
MCGIAGLINMDGRPADRTVLRNMVAFLGHRGPDESGVFTDESVGLAHSRLSIIDIATGQQPMANSDRSIWISFNGEIFNYSELRDELRVKGWQFATASDTEVLLHLYEEEGPNCVQRLNGQWAFAIWDGRERRLILSRDRMGICPLFYTQTKRELVFGSEIKALFAHPSARRELDLSSLAQVFTFWCTLPPRTSFKDIFELPPGHNLIFEKGRGRIEQYWELQYPAAGEASDTTDAAVTQKAEELRHLLDDATRIRLRADVPVAAYLSGGLDSTVVTALIRKHNKNGLRTFSVSFADPEFDEAAYQREASAFIGTEHQEVQCSYCDIADSFPDVIWHAEKPVVRTAPAPMYRLSALVRNNGFKVVLTGEGSDEILAGYDIFREAKVRRFWGAQPASRLRPLLLRRLYPYLGNLRKQSDTYLASFFQINAENLESPFFSHLPRWTLTSRLKMFFSEETLLLAKTHDPYAELSALLPAAYSTWPAGCQAEYLEAKFLLPGYILSSQGERMAMAHSVEDRYPFLDHRVVEFATQLPARLKLKVLNEKYLLKRAAIGLVPDSILYRPKQAYRAPDGRSFFDGRPFDYVEELLSPARLKRDGIFKPGTVTKLVEKFKAGRALGVKDDMALVGILSTQLLVYQFINDFANQRRSMMAVHNSDQ